MLARRYDPRRDEFGTDVEIGERSSMRWSWQVAFLLAILCVGAGCLSARRYPPPDLPPSARLIPADGPKKDVPAEVIPASHAPAPRTVLAISGGGLCGAYTVGVLKGWSDAGTRPKFDVVTGISTGGLIAPLAFLGAESDDLLEEWYTSTRPGDIYRRRSLPTLLWSDSLADSTPLRRRIETVVTPEFLSRIAAEHTAGRRLYVGTTDLDSKRLVVWDLGAIAASDDPGKLELFRNVLLASCAVPGLLSPVAIDVEVNGQRRTELHVDGGVSAQAFVPPQALRDTSAANSPGMSVFVIVSGKVVPHWRPVPLRLIDVSEESLNGLLRAQIRGDLQRISLQAKMAGAGFGFTAVPDEFAAGEAAQIGPQLLRRLFSEGYHFGRSGTNWRRALPGLDADDEPPPRTGIRFNVNEERPPRGAINQPSPNK